MAARARPAPLLDRLAAIVGPAYLLTDPAERRFHATDVYNFDQLPDAVVRPGSVAEIQAIVRACHDTLTPLVTRGGGASYTDGYTHARPGGITLDTSRLTAIDIDGPNAIVTVEAGVTWASLWTALKACGLRTPFWGPFSGLAATVGGATSQNAVSHGLGVSAESVIGFDIVTGTGELLSTGAGGSANGGVPFFRAFGPDLAGLFAGDCGALGIKARITLRLIRRHEACETASFAFDDFEALHDAMRRVALEAVVEEHFALDATLQQGQLGKADGVAAKAGIAASVLRNAPSLAGGVRALARMAMAGDRDLKAAAFALHYTVDGIDAAEARARIEAVRRIAGAAGREIANTMPAVIRGAPFEPLLSTLGPAGQRWVPVHGLLPHGKVADFRAALLAYYAANRAELDRFEIVTGALFMAVGSTALLYEPTFWWPDARTDYHARVVPAAHLAGLREYPPNPAARAAVARMKIDLGALFHAHGAAHFQIGKFYRYLDGRNAASVALLRAVKAALDPAGILNPGVLGL